MISDHASHIGGITIDNYMDLECPYPGVSYCESISPLVLTSDMFISRFNVEYIAVGIEDQYTIPSNEQIAIVPVSEHQLMIELSDPTLSVEIEIYNALGALVWSGKVSGTRMISTMDWGFGVYTAIGVEAGSTSLHRSEKFLVR